VLRFSAARTTSGFNGAAFFQSGKYPNETATRIGRGQRFNGAAFFQSGKSCVTLFRLSRTGTYASMEPLFFKAENLIVLTKPLWGVLASMEPLFFKAENNPGRRQNRAFRDASMEPLFFKAENLLSGGTRSTSLKRFNGAAFFQSGK